MYLNQVLIRYYLFAVKNCIEKSIKNRIFAQKLNFILNGKRINSLCREIDCHEGRFTYSTLFTFDYSSRSFDNYRTAS